ncbi:MAG: DUF3152 domain-containing protein [Propionibacteriaceae bacterium]|nr:DUF3152 domain-containing protein [Propionibacteriaceae bacterium]
MTSPAPSSRPRWLSGKLVLSLALGVVLLVGLGVWANALTEPVIRAGVPTGSVTPPPPKPISTPTPTPTMSGEPSATPSDSGKPSSSAKPSESAKPSGSAKPKPSESATPDAKPKFDTSSVEQLPVSSTGTKHSFIVKVQSGKGLKADDVAKEVAKVLNDPRSWTGDGSVRFALVADAEQADFTVFVADPSVVDAKCDAKSWLCVRAGKLALGLTGWTKGATTYGDDLTGFRRYLVNHAIGLQLGEKKTTCKTKGKPAPVMAPQGDDLKGCTPNPWPHG